jgi:hypothetical protein
MSDDAEKLRMAAELGKQLLSKNKKLEEQLSSMSEQLSRATREASEQRRRCDEARNASRDAEQRVGSLASEVDRLERAGVEAELQIRELSEWQRRGRAAEDNAERLKARVGELQESLEAESKRCARLESEVERANVDSDNRESLAEQLRAARDEIGELRVSRRALDGAKQRLEAARVEMQRLAGVDDDKSRLQEAVKNLARANVHLQKERDELATLLSVRGDGGAAVNNDDDDDDDDAFNASLADEIALAHVLSDDDNDDDDDDVTAPPDLLLPPVQQSLDMNFMSEILDLRDMLEYAQSLITARSLPESMTTRLQTSDTVIGTAIDLAKSLLEREGELKLVGKGRELCSLVLELVLESAELRIANNRLRLDIEQLNDVHAQLHAQHIELRQQHRQQQEQQQQRRWLPSFFQSSSPTPSAAAANSSESAAHEAPPSDIDSTVVPASASPR